MGDPMALIVHQIAASCLAAQSNPCVRPAHSHESLIWESGRAPQPRGIDDGASTRMVGSRSDGWRLAGIPLWYPVGLTVSQQGFSGLPAAARQTSTNARPSHACFGLALE